MRNEIMKDEEKKCVYRFLYFSNNSRKANIFVFCFFLVCVVSSTSISSKNVLSKVVRMSSNILQN